METTAVKLYSTGLPRGEDLPRGDALRGRQHRPAPNLPPRAAGRPAVAADLFLHAGRRLQIRLAGGPADRTCARRWRTQLLFGMPAAAALPVILLKSVLLAVAASHAAARRAACVALPLLAGVVLFYQAGRLAGRMGPGLARSHAAVQDIRIGLPGMLAQVFAGYAVLRYLLL